MKCSSKFSLLTFNMDKGQSCLKPMNSVLYVILKEIMSLAVCSRLCRIHSACASVCGGDT